MQNQISLKPNCFISGITIGIKIRMIETSSRTKPARKARNRISSRVGQAVKPIPCSASCIIVMPPAETKIPANMVPPKRIIKIIAVITIVLMKACDSTANVKVL